MTSTQAVANLMKISVPVDFTNDHAYREVHSNETVASNAYIRRKFIRTQTANFRPVLELHATS